jgi:hypothetical protein
MAHTSGHERQEPGVLAREPCPDVLGHCDAQERERDSVARRLIWGSDRSREVRSINHPSTSNSQKYINQSNRNQSDPSQATDRSIDQREIEWCQPRTHSNVAGFIWRICVVVRLEPCQRSWPPLKKFAVCPSRTAFLAEPARRGRQADAAGSIAEHR